MKRTLLSALFLTALTTGAAFAGECSPADEQLGGKVAADLSKNAVIAIAPVEGRQMINITSCDTRAGTVRVEFRYNYMSGGAYYWLEARADVKGPGDGALTTKRLSDNLEAANTAKGGTLLASR